MVANKKEQDTPVPPPPQLFLASQPVECVQSYKYLRFIITSRSEHIQSICNEWKNCGLTLLPVLPECRFGYPPLILYLSCNQATSWICMHSMEPLPGKRENPSGGSAKVWIFIIAKTEVTKAGCINVCAALTSNSTASGESCTWYKSRFYTHTRSGLAPWRQNCFQFSWGQLLKGDGEWPRAAEMDDQYGALWFLFCPQSTCNSRRNAQVVG